MKIKGLKSFVFALSLTAMLPQTAFAKEKYILPDGGQTAVKESTLSKLDEEKLMLARNEIAARHGKIFYDEDMKKYFDSQSFYKSAADYDDSCLTTTEKENIDMIYKYELSRKQENARNKFEENKRLSEKGDMQVASSSWVYMESPYYLDDLLGRWIDNSDPEYPMVLDFQMKDGLPYYRYYGIVPGNGMGLDIANSYSEFEYCTGTFSLNSEIGFINCYVGNTEKLYHSFEYDVMSDTLVETSMDKNRKTFTKDNDFTYELPKTPQ